MKRTALAAIAAGTMLVAVPPSAFASSSWQPGSGSVTIDAVNPCTGTSADFTLVWTQFKVKATKSGTVRTGLAGTYTATDGSAGTVRTSSSTTYTTDGYADSYHQVLLGSYEGRTQRISFVFRIVVGADSDVKVMQQGSSCGG